MQRIVSQFQHMGKYSAGATLIEVMIALVIMSIGLLGLASLQLSGVNANSNSEQRTQATIIANDLIERMRANPAGVTWNQYVTAFSNPINCAVPPAAYCEDHNGTAAATCSSQSSVTSNTPPATDMANFDAYTVTCNASNLLPNSAISLACTDTSNNPNNPVACSTAIPSTTPFRIVTVNWKEQTDNGYVTKTLSYVFQPLAFTP